MIIIQTTIGSEEEARELTNYLVNKQLIACGTFTKIQSIYKWEGKIQQESEYEIDGIIVTHNKSYIRNTSGNPKYSFAFKMLTSFK